MKTTVVAALYKFVRLPDFETLRSPLHKVMTDNEVRGTVLLAAEGVNGTIAGTREGVDAVLDFLRADPRINTLTAKESYTQENPFYRSKVKLKKEIVTMGVEDIDPNDIVGTYVKPEDWNALIADPDVLLVDTRNDYEVQIGSFKNALNPKTESFREFHRRHPLREVHGLHEAAGLQRGLSPRGWHSQIPRGGASGEVFVGGGVLRLRQSCDRQSPIGEGFLRSMSRLSHANYRTRYGIGAVPAWHQLSALL